MLLFIMSTCFKTSENGGWSRTAERHLKENSVPHWSHMDITHLSRHAASQPCLHFSRSPSSRVRYSLASGYALLYCPLVHRRNQAGCCDSTRFKEDEALTESTRQRWMRHFFSYQLTYRALFNYQSLTHSHTTEAVGLQPCKEQCPSIGGSVGFSV